MDKPKFTPGPWAVSAFKDKVYEAKEGFYVAEIPLRNREANMNLIATAPDMYEALRAGKSGAILNGPELLERVAEIINHQYTKLAAALRHKANLERAALAKAEGRD